MIIDFNLVYSIALGVALGGSVLLTFNHLLQKGYIGGCVVWTLKAVAFLLGVVLGLLSLAYTLTFGTAKRAIVTTVVVITLLMVLLGR